MINLNNIDMVLFDFDNTLCIHKSHNTAPDREYNKNIILGKNCYEKCDMNTHMKKFMTACELRSIRMGLISSTVSYKHMQAKHDWVLNNYGADLDNYCVGNPESKIEIMIAISDALNIERNRILIVDDLCSTLELAANNGFSACTPMEVVNYIDLI